MLSNVASGVDSDDAVNVAQLQTTVSALGGGAHINGDGSITAPTYTVAGQSYNNVGDALAETNKVSVQYDTDSSGNRLNSISLSGSASGPVAIHNVADGTELSDAATVRQVAISELSSFYYTDQRVEQMQAENQQRFAQLSGEIAQSRGEARGGIASAMAMAALRFDPRPGKLSFASGIGSFKGSSSIVAGIGYTSEEGNFRVNASVSHSMATQDTSFNAGLSFTLN
nr:YadA-like family protein [Allorhizobium sonneratiae]